ncbi:MAG: PRC-barrel domain containing protein [Xanthobacteraceae bacterium]|jgi:hypothetical protein
MLRNASTLHGYGIAASDGHLGVVTDLLFEDTSWLLRWLVVDTGHWLPGRKVLLPATVLGLVDPEKREFSVRLTMAEVRHSPDIDTERPVSRQIETDLYDFYGWRPYWNPGLYLDGFGNGYGGGATMPLPVPGSARLEEDIAAAERDHDDPHLRSVQAVTGYHVHASDGEIGHVADFLIEDADWSIRYLVVDTRNWWPGNKVLISPRSVRGVEWEDRFVNLTVDRQAVKSSPAYDASMTIDRTYERRLHGYYADISSGGSDRLLLP